MKCYSSRDRHYRVPLRDAVLRGMPPDGGLFMPAVLPPLPAPFLAGLSDMTFVELATEVAVALLGDDLSPAVLAELVGDAFDFEVPLVPLGNGIHTLELFHGPTLAFKDFGARFMSRLMARYLAGENRGVTILVATSGDTGSAVAAGFHQVAGFQVVILYPSGQVSHIQEQQLTTLEGNVTALEVAGAFDDCQALVKQAFADGELAAAMNLTSANSINLARLIPQTFYYFQIGARLPHTGPEGTVVAVPSGNFGNLTAGLMARRMGAPIRRFVTATNANDVVPEYLRTGRFVPRPSIRTISNAMDVGHPSNFERIMDLYDGSLAAVRRDLAGYAFSDDETRRTIREVFETTGYRLDPHGAVGLLGLQAARAGEAAGEGVFLETAHPAKFADIVEPVIGEAVPPPARLRQCLERPKRATPIAADFSLFRDFLLQAVRPAL